MYRRALSQSYDRWPRGDLTHELRVEAARHRRAARWTAAVRGDAIVSDPVAAARDECVAARPASRVFEMTDAAGQVPPIDELQAGLTSDVSGLHHHVGRGVRRVFHLV